MSRPQRDAKISALISDIRASKSLARRDDLFDQIIGVWEDSAPFVQCEWTPDARKPATWSSSCGASRTFIEGGPKENRVNYCHHCGGKVTIST